ncbi:MAG: DUF3237 domain-containing protein [Rhizobiaceae bacterium]|nr:DUF3237 domain-containing protein [Rhizobiaceae bacterium]
MRVSKGIPHPVTPSLEFEFSITAEISAPKSGGSGLYGELLHIPILGGMLEGERISGKILPGGSDWPVIRKDGSSEIRASYSIETNDGVFIRIINEGLRVSSAEVMNRLRAGKKVDPSEYYFRASPRFEVSDGRYQWLREHVFVASLAPFSGGIAINVYRVL